MAAKKSMALGGGARFQALTEKLESQGKSAGAAKAIAASVGRAKLGKAKFQALAAKGRKRAAAKGR